MEFFIFSFRGSAQCNCFKHPDYKHFCIDVYSAYLLLGQGKTIKYDTTIYLYMTRAQGEVNCKDCGTIFD
jgi:hypothetical protein